MNLTGSIHIERYIMATVVLNGGTASLQVKNEDSVGFVDIPLPTDGAHIVFVGPCVYQVALTGGALVGLS
jgi:hypothetical protein